MMTRFCHICGRKEKEFDRYFYMYPWNNKMDMDLCGDCYRKVYDFGDIKFRYPQNETVIRMKHEVYKLYCQNPEFFKLYILTGP